MSELKLYTDLASWWPLLSRPEDYAEEAAFYQKTLTEAGLQPGASLLELGSGGGNNASYLKKHFRMTLVDRSTAMLAVSRELNPELEHISGDMRTVRLDRQFEAVFIHDAIVYMTSEADLFQAIQTSYIHCRPGGAALFAPDHTRETFRPSTDHGGYDAPDGSGRGMRYLEWMWDPDPSDSTYRSDFAYLLRDADGTITSGHDVHITGLFSKGTWLRLIETAGFQASSIPFEHSQIEPGTGILFLGRR